MDQRIESFLEFVQSSDLLLGRGYDAPALGAPWGTTDGDLVQGPLLNTSISRNAPFAAVGHTSVDSLSPAHQAKKYSPTLWVKKLAQTPAWTPLIHRTHFPDSFRRATFAFLLCLAHMEIRLPAAIKAHVMSYAAPQPHKNGGGKLSWTFRELQEESAARELLAQCTPAPSGDLSIHQTIYNPNIRFSFEKKPDEWGLENCWKFLTGAKLAVARWLAVRRVRLDPHKLNCCPVGGSTADAHRDNTTRYSDDQVGSLVVILPSPHQGGSLVLQQEEGSVPMDVSGKPEALKICAFFSDVIHRVLPVTSGVRVTLTFNVVSVATDKEFNGGGDYLDTDVFQLDRMSPVIM